MNFESRFFDGISSFWISTYSYEYFPGGNCGCSPMKLPLLHCFRYVANIKVNVKTTLMFVTISSLVSTYFFVKYELLSKNTISTQKKRFKSFRILPVLGRNDFGRNDVGKMKMPINPIQGLGRNVGRFLRRMIAKNFYWKCVGWYSIGVL